MQHQISVFSLPAASRRYAIFDQSQSFVSITDNNVPRSAVEQTSPAGWTAAGVSLSTTAAAGVANIVTLLNSLISQLALLGSCGN